VTALSLEHFRREVRAWLDGNAKRREPAGSRPWGEGDERVPVFRNLDAAAERADVDRLRAWRARKFDAGMAAVWFEPEYGGRGLPPIYESVVAEEEVDFDVPAMHEAVQITTDLIAPTLRVAGTAAQRARHLRRMLRTDDMWCQLFSEPGAGSDLAGVATTATRDGDEWVISGQKVWTSGAQFADFGYVLCRSDRAAPKHGGLTAFIVSMEAPGIEVRPLRQMTGGASFNEVFLDDVRVHDDARLGAEGDGWRVALATLGFERVAGSGDNGVVVERFRRLAALARHLGRDRDVVLRQGLADLYARARMLELTNARVRTALQAGAAPGPEGSIGKLSYSGALCAATTVAGALLGPSLVADTGEWGTFAWAEHALGAPGFRVAGGTDEIQRTIIAERVLGLPPEPRPAS
jgi:alkylation response protein AidB-like acyl-CoA dehydrogenase